MAQEPLFNQADAQVAWQELRASKAFPAIVGGAAGAAIGLALLFIGSRRRAPKKTLPAAYDAGGNPMNIVYLPAPQSPRVMGFTPGDLITLATIGISLIRQVQDMGKIKDLEQETAVKDDQKEILEAKTGVQAPPAHMVPAAQKK